ncbi:YjbH domain-containing protein [Aliiruegeria sabulilitoris]|uniref:YjbH domain-containing protein n=1 Tax=Aliiruegeria sabulilitoris TaxID=1510458 RepID=UPI00082A4A3E|nr:YjbH domain-containing protein [Aliiruegeria sabulilitoris]
MKSGLSFYGMPGVIDTPSAEMLPDGEATFTVSMYPDRLRTTLGFQFTPWLYVSYQYTAAKDLFENEREFYGGAYYDRSFGVALRLLEEKQWTPSVVVGINDLVGTGVFASEYIVATKNIQDRFKLSAGVGWGRLGSYGSFKNPLSFIDSRFETRPETDFGEGGTFSASEWFRGPAALFGSAEWAINDKWTALIEYSSDAYDQEVEAVGFDRATPINFGLNYSPRPGIDIGLYSLYGSKIGINASFTTNPKAPPFRGGREVAPPPISPRAGGTVDLAAWGLPSEQLRASDPVALKETVSEAFKKEKLRLEGMEIVGDEVHVAFTNNGFDAQPQALGRASRILAAIIPSEVDTFVLKPLVFGMPTSTIRISRNDLEELEFDPDRVWKSYVRAEVNDAEELSFASFISDSYPQFSGFIRPYFAPSFFDPDQPVRADIGLDIGGSYRPLPGLVLSGVYRQKLLGDRDTVTRMSDSVLPHVRSDLALYDVNSSSYLSHLTAEYFFRPGENLYARGTVGILERMYGGASAELLWKPVDGPLALGGEINYAVQRDFDGGFGFQDYDVVTGHLSAYYDLGKGYFGQVDAGRYLAGDYGATFTLSREFANGVRVGAFATQTDVSYEDFGEGSFDKGFFFEVPFSWLGGVPSRRGFTQVIRPILRDGGARLSVRNRLYENVRDFHDPELRNRWSRYWR